MDDTSCRTQSTPQYFCFYLFSRQNYNFAMDTVSTGKKQRRQPSDDPRKGNHQAKADDLKEDKRNNSL